jgi:hypothetical protein
MQRRNQRVKASHCRWRRDGRGSLTRGAAFPPTRRAGDGRRIVPNTRAPPVGQAGQHERKRSGSPSPCRQRATVKRSQAARPHFRGHRSKPLRCRLRASRPRVLVGMRSRLAAHPERRHAGWWRNAVASSSREAAGRKYGRLMIALHARLASCPAPSRSCRQFAVEQCRARKTAKQQRFGRDRRRWEWPGYDGIDEPQHRPLPWGRQSGSRFADGRYHSLASTPTLTAACKVATSPSSLPRHPKESCGGLYCVITPQSLKPLVGRANPPRRQTK